MSLTLRRSVQEWLDQLPTDPDLIAQQLRVAGVQGVPGDPTACVVAQYLQQRTGLVSDVDSLAGTIYAHAARSVWTMPAALLQFVHWFDFGVYPDLTRPVTVGAGRWRASPRPSG